MKEENKTGKNAVTRRSVHLPDEVYENICALAREKHTTPAAIMRSLITKGITVGFIEDSEGLIRRIIHEEMITVLDHEIDRLIKLMAKCTKVAAASLFLLILLLINDYAGEMSITDLLANAFKQAAKYMRMKDKTHDEYVAEAREFISGAKSIGIKDDN